MNLLLTLLLMVFSNPIFVQDNEPLDPEADRILDIISKKYQAYETAEIDIALFIDMPETDEDQKLDVKAWIKGDKFKIDLKDQMFVSNNVALWNYLKEYNEVQINNYEESDAIFSPSVIFNLYKEDYIYRLKESYKNKNGESIKIIELSPTDKDQNFFKLDLAINSNNEIVQAKIYERSGMRYIYTIKNFKPNVELEDDFFIFNPDDYKNIDIIDARF